MDNVNNGIKGISDSHFRISQKYLRNVLSTAIAMTQNYYCTLNYLRKTLAVISKARPEETETGDYTHILLDDDDIFSISHL